jgi:hypothetical protein
MLSGREIIFEIKPAGAYAQVCAIDCATGTEVFVTTPVNASQSDQRTLALRKLAKVLKDDGHVLLDGGSVSASPTSASPTSANLTLASPKTENKGEALISAPPKSPRGLIA